MHNQTNSIKFKSRHFESKSLNIHAILAYSFLIFYYFIFCCCKSNPNSDAIWTETQFTFDTYETLKQVEQKSHTHREKISRLCSCELLRNCLLINFINILIRISFTFQYFLEYEMRFFSRERIHTLCGLCGVFLLWLNEKWS